MKSTGREVKYEPIQADVRCGVGMVRAGGGTDEEDALDVHVTDAVRARYVGSGSRQRQA